MPYYVLTLLFVLLGAYSIAAQIYFVRELLVIFFGNELCLGIVFAGWFAGIGLGAACGGRKSKSIQHIIPGFLTGLIILCLEPFLIIPVMRMVRAIVQVPSVGYASILHIAGATLISICPFSFMNGFIFPMACRVLMGDEGKGSLQIGWVYVWESVGSLAGGLAITFVLIPRFPPMVVFAWGSLMIFISSLLFACLLPKEKGLRALKALFTVLSAVGVIVLAGDGLSVFDKYMEKLRWKTFNNSLRLIVSRDSAYQNIVLAEAQGQYSLFANGNFLGIYPDEHQSALRAHFFLCQHPFPQRVLLIGMGITGFLRQTLKHPVKSVDYVEFDPELVRMVSPILNAEDRAAMEDRRVTIFYMDGRRYVKKTARKYDVIIVDVPDPSTAMLNRFYTVNFFKEAREILTDSGILVTGISSAVNYVSPETADYNGSLFRGLQQVFPFVMVVPGERNYFFASARKGVLTDDPAALSKRYQHRNVHSKYFSAALFQWLVQKDRIEFMEDALKTKADTLLNTDFHPVTYFYNLVIWDILSGAKGRRHIFQEIREKGVWWAAAPLGFVFILASILIIVKKPKRLVCFSNLWVISTTGFAGMSMEMILIFMFQSLYGYIYGKIGIVVALFMLGLAIGSLGMRSRLKKAEGTAMGTLIVLEIIICTYALAVPFLLRALAGTAYAGSGMFFSTEYIYFSLIFAIGLFVGMEFPLVCHLLIRNGYRSSSVAGWVDALDHIGAGVGALLTGTILLPLLGTYSTCLIVVFFKLTCIGFLIMTIKSDLLKT